ncbi:hypothetical protein [Marininema halotolerans]|uniref:Uncharacterized protein n=1 Tax=Marininema halotolerans TaxID=1155944 RepID=A0A1I6Q094_9BACL|nr:hypothetical protein [Marininema halotolerans]SFS45750.1 hypothetical protein SAMN05444972_102248 [Marininema halotolerans]
MDYLKHTEIASVILYDLRWSESDLMIYDDLIDYVVGKCTDEEILDITDGESREVLLFLQNELRDLIKKHVLPQYLPDKYKDKS